MEILSVEKEIKPKFTKISKVNYSNKGKEMSWEYVESLNSVHILVYNRDSKKFLFVKQLRIPVLMNQKDSSGYVIECCAGLVDKQLSLIEIAREELLEELGYKTNDLDFKDNLLSSVGLIGQNMSLFTCVVSEDDFISLGGGIDNEDIEIIEVDYKGLSELKVDLVTKYMIDTYAKELINSLEILS